MSNVLQHQGYLGSIEFSLEDKLLFGKILHIKDLISYGGETIEELECNFHEAVDDYLALCAEVGIEPRKPFKGSFNVRTQPEKHEAIAYQAALEGVKLNQFVNMAIDQYLKDGLRPQENHYHEHKQTIFVGDISDSHETGVIPSEQIKIVSEGATSKGSALSH